MPEVIVNMAAGRTDEQKKGMMLEFDSGDSVLLIGVHKLNDADFLIFS